MSRYRYLTLEDREKLEGLYLNGDRPQDITDAIGIHYVLPADKIGADKIIRSNLRKAAPLIFLLEVMQLIICKISS